MLVIKGKSKYYNRLRISEAKFRKIIVFGLLKRGNKVYTKIIEKCDRATLQAIIIDKTSTDRT